MCVGSFRFRENDPVTHPRRINLSHFWLFPIRSGRTAEYRYGLSTSEPDAMANGHRKHQASLGSKANGRIDGAHQGTGDDRARRIAGIWGFAAARSFRGDGTT